MPSQEYSESSAGQYWCPYAYPAVHAGNGSGVAVNRYPDQGRGGEDASQRCYGRRCAKWEPSATTPGAGRCGRS